MGRTAVRRTAQGLLLSMLLLTVLPMSQAQAAQLAGPPAADGHWIHCDLAYGSATAANKEMMLACQYGPVTAQVKTINVRISNTAQSSAVTFGCTGTACNKSTTATTNPVQHNENGHFLMSGIQTSSAFTVDESKTGTPSSFAIAPNTSATNAYATSTTNCGNTAICDVIGLTQHPGNIATMPADFFPGGSATADDTSVGGTPTDTNGGAGTDTTQADCGAWWHIGCWISNALKKLFVPDPATMASEFNDVRASLAGRYPFGPIVWVITGLTDMYTAVKNGITAANPTEGLSVTLTMPGDHNIPISVLPGTLTGGDATALGGLQTLCHAIMTAVWIACLMAFAWTMYGKLGGLSEGDS